MCLNDFKNLLIQMDVATNKKYNLKLPKPEHDQIIDFVESQIPSFLSIIFGFIIYTTGTASNRADVSGLPFTSLTTSGFGAGGRAGTMIVREDGLTGNFYGGYVNGGDTSFQITALTFGAINWSVGAAYVSSFVYETNS